MSKADQRWMRMALGLGRRNLGNTGANPSVGCVIVRDNRVIGRAVTALGGAPHAETQALSMAGDTHGATAYVTLEPCAHQGRTGPCAQALIDAGITRVVSAVCDPNPKVAGKGHAMLTAAGVTVECGLLEAEATRDHAGFFKRITIGMPLVTLKLASTLDGRIATGSGESKWITGPMARRRTHLLRAQHDAILVGSGTALADDPDMRVRELGLNQYAPIRVLLDRRRVVPSDAKLFQNQDKAPTWVFSTERNENGTRFFRGKTAQEGLDLEFVLRTLANEGISRVFCEGGGILAASLLKGGFVDRLVHFQAGKIIGGDGLNMIAALGLKNLSEVPNFTLYRSQKIGADILAEWDRIAH